MQLKNTHRLCFFLILFLLPLYGTGQTEQGAVYEKIDSVLNQAVQLDVFSGNVLIVHDNRTVYEKSFGKADAQKNIDNSTETKFQLASITKDFTRVMILTLEEKGILSTKDQIGKYLSGFSEEANKVTIDQLMNFTSGFGDYLRSPELRGQKDKIMVIKDIVPIIQKERLQFIPGTKTLYSNSGYVLLGAIIEATTHKSYYDNLKELILYKLDMHNTAVNGYVPPMPGIAIGYLNNEISGMGNNANWQIPGGGDGGIYTTTHDILKFITSIFYDNKLLSDTSKLKYVGTVPQTSKYKSWTEFVASGSYSPAGGAPGISTLFAIDMSTRNIVILLSNYDQGTAEDMWIRISAILKNKPMPPVHQSAAKVFYHLIRDKGGEYFETNYKEEFKKFGDRVDDMSLYRIGQEFIKGNDYDNALSLYKVFTQEYPGIIIAWNDMGEVYAQKGDVANAKICFEKALKINPENKRALDNIKKLSMK